MKNIKLQMTLVIAVSDEEAETIRTCKSEDLEQDYSALLFESPLTTFICEPTDEEAWT